MRLWDRSSDNFSPDTIFDFASELSVERDSLLVPITFYELDKVAFRVAKENDPTTWDVLTDISDGIGFDAVRPQRFNSRFKLGRVEGQMLKSDTLLAAFLIGERGLAWVKLQSNRAKS